MRMQADLKLQVGTRLFYNCPTMCVEDSKSRAFFKKYHGREATVVGFTTVLVPPLDHKGRVPGVYYDGGLRVQFDGDEEIFDRLNLNHFVVIGPAEVVPGEVNNFVSDLPEMPAFYPFDMVAKIDDLLAVPRFVTSIDFNREGRLVCGLADTEDMERLREQKEAAEREKATVEKLWLPTFAFRSNETVLATDLRLLERGNGFRLYHDPDSLDFSSPEEELEFWALDGLSSTVFVDGNWIFSPTEAREMVHVGQADMIVVSSMGRHRVGDKVVYSYEVKKLHDCFGQFRSRVSSLVEKVGPIAKNRNDSSKKLSDILTGDR
jgi:hypothetical protein